jgi:hypothetical protein
MRTKNKPKVLVACEFTGVVRDAFLNQGCNAISCDLLPTEVQGPHYQGDVQDVLYGRYDLIIAHPPCTYLSNVGGFRLYKDKDRLMKLDDGAAFFRLFLDHPCKRICIENPIMHCWAKAIVGKDYTQIVQPWQFGHNESKATCLWLKGLPKLQPTCISLKHKSVTQDKFYDFDMKDLGKERSRTYKGIAKAMASQWSPYL